MLVFLKVFNRLLLHAAAVSSRKTKPLNNETVFAKKKKKYLEIYITCTHDDKNIVLRFAVSMGKIAQYHG